MLHIFYGAQDCRAKVRPFWILLLSELPVSPTQLCVEYFFVLVIQKCYQDKSRCLILLTLTKMQWTFLISRLFIAQGNFLLLYFWLLLQYHLFWFLPQDSQSPRDLIFAFSSPIPLLSLVPSICPCPGGKICLENSGLGQE